MEKYFVTYNQALALKELGYNKKCLAWYNWTGKELLFTNNQYADIDPTNAPLKQQVFEWFRKEHGLHIGICHAVNNKFDCWTNNGNLLDGGEYCDFETYEEAESACIDKLIEIVKGQ